MIPITTATGTTGTPIRSAAPHAIAITPDGTTAYVANWGFGTVTPIDIATGTAGTADPGRHEPQVPSRSRRTARPPTSPTTGDNTVTPVNIATRTAGTPITVGSDPDAIAVTRTVNRLRRQLGDDTVTPIDIATGTAGTPITVGTYPVAIAITAGQAPAITSAAATTFTTGTAGTFTVTATGAAGPRPDRDRRAAVGRHA